MIGRTRTAVSAPGPALHTVASATDHTIRSGEVELAVRTWGQRRDAPPLVLVHGFPDNQTVWEPVIAHLEASRYVITYDVRGAGRSTAPARTSGYSMARLAEDLVAVLDAFAPGQPVHVVGHDWGGIQLWEPVTDPQLRARFASFTSIAAPSIDQSAHFLREHAWREVGAQLVKSWYVMLFQLPGAPLLWKLVGDRWGEYMNRVEGIDPTPGDRSVDGARGVGLYRANILPRITRPRARTTDVPVQLLVAVRDVAELPRLFDDVPRWAPYSVRRELAAGHWMIVSHLEHIARAISTWVDDLDAGNRPARARTGPLAGKLAVVTGAGSGIGRATVFELLERGVEVIAADIDLAAASLTAELGGLLGGSVHAMRVDVADPRAMTDFGDRVAREHGVPDIVVNNAGIAVAGSFLATTQEEWSRVLSVNLDGVASGCRVFAQKMIDDLRPGHIINVASAAAFGPSKALAAYSTSKAAVVMLSECLRADLASANIKVGVVCPGFVATSITSNTRFAGEDSEREQGKRRMAGRLYRRRGLVADDVARAIVDAILTDRPVTLVGAEAHGMRWLQRLSPALTRAIARIDLLPGGSR